MEWQAFRLSLELAAWTTVILLPLALVIARFLAWHSFRGQSLVQALVALPLLLPPTVLGFYLLTAFASDGWLGRFYETLVGQPLAFTFEGLLLASILFNVPFAVQPMQRGFEAVSRDVREAAWCSGMSRWSTFLRIELPLAWPGLLSAFVLTFAHTLGEFGVVLMVGGSIPGETRTIAIAIYDRMQAFDESAAASMAAVLLGFSLAAIALVHVLGGRVGARRG
ncbi:MAG TPA: molybdate ABC transporter permease subunit [Kiloniellales bacterium]|nr:molybdate ABC transporter permease subunit [Kiloniellales bacterium]